MTAGGGYVTREKEGRFVWYQNSAGFRSLVKTLLPRVKKLPIDCNDHWPGEFGKMPTTELGQ
jgi:hypothetical protein